MTTYARGTPVWFDKCTTMQLYHHIWLNPDVIDHWQHIRHRHLSIYHHEQSSRLLLVSTWLRLWSFGWLTQCGGREFPGHRAELLRWWREVHTMARRSSRRPRRNRTPFAVPRRSLRGVARLGRPHRTFPTCGPSWSCIQHRRRCGNGGGDGGAQLKASAREWMLAKHILILKLVFRCSLYDR
jgi:hypothetical protein